METAKVCPLPFVYNPSTLKKCIRGKCAWWVGDECAFTAYWNMLEAIRQELVKPPIEE